ncbi:MAG TPA: hypothetical protein VFH94_30175 [Streptomyces sp.]|nr:hypothetical protein [Streptomyces sp.]
MSRPADLRYGAPAGHHLSWQGRQVAVLEKRPAALPGDVRWTRLPRLDRCTLAAAYALDAATHGAVRAGGARAAAVVRVSWASLDGVRTYMDRTSRRHGAIARDFAHMGGTSTCHYLATCLDIKGYATVLFDDPAGRTASTAADDVAQLPYIDTLCQITVRLRPDTANRLMNALAPATEEVSARLTTFPSREVE